MSVESMYSELPLLRACKWVDELSDYTTQVVGWTMYNLCTYCVLCDDRKWVFGGRGLNYRHMAITY